MTGRLESVTEWFAGIPSVPMAMSGCIQTYYEKDRMGKSGGGTGLALNSVPPPVGV